MSAVALQRVVVRMLFDPTFTRSVFDGPTPPEITPQEHAWLRATDPRAFRIDRYRRSRGLAVLIEEYPAASALAIREFGLPRVDGFFSSKSFHRGMQQGRSLALLFAAYLRTLPGAVEFSNALAIESAFAVLRRTPGVGPSADYSLASSARVMELPGGALAGYEDVLSTLRASGKPLVEAVADGGLRISRAAKPESEASDRVLLFVDPARESDARVERLSDELFELLGLCEGGVDGATLLRRFGELGATADEALEILEEFVRTGELTRPPTS